MARTESRPCTGQLRRLGISLTAFLLVTAVLTGCGGEGTSVNSTATGPTAGGPLSVHVTTDDTYKVQQQLTAASGGTITAMGADGTTYVLAIQAGALPADTTVSLTPIASISGLPLSGGMANGVQFAPEGLVLNTPATLTVYPANPIPLAQLIGFGYTALGDHFHLEPTGGDGTTIVMAVPHFSGAGTARGTAADATALSQQYTPWSLADSFSEELAILVAQYGAGQISEATFDAKVAQAISSYYETVINPQLTAGLDSDAAFTSGAQAGMSFLRELVIPGLEPEEPPTLDSEILGLIEQGFHNFLSRAAQTCTDTQDYTVLDKVIAAERRGVLLGYLPDGAFDFSKFGGCVIFAVVPYPATATVNIKGTQLYWLKLLNQQNQPLKNADAAKFDWTAENASVATAVAQGNQQGEATGLQEGSTAIVPSPGTNARTATSLGIGDTQIGTATLTVTKPPSDCAAYLSVTHWTVNIVASFSQHATGSPQSDPTETEDDTVSHQLNYTFNISGGPGAVWQGSGAVGQANVSDTNVATISNPPPPTSHHTTASATAIGGGAALSSFTLTIDPNACTYSFGAELNAEVTYTHDAPQPPGTSSAFGDGVRRAGDALAAVAPGATPTITGQAQIPAYNITSPQLGSNPNLNAYVPQLGEAPVLSEILGDPLGSSATVSWTLTAVQ